MLIYLLCDFLKNELIWPKVTHNNFIIIIAKQSSDNAQYSSPDGFLAQSSSVHHTQFQFHLQETENDPNL